MEVFIFQSGQLDRLSLVDKVRRWEAIGVTGVLIPDHFFVASDGQRDKSTVQPDPFVALSAIGAMSPSLSMGTIVANCGLVHPAWVLRHLAQLATLYGGQRVLAGLGAGWNAEEFDALGLSMPSYHERLLRLEEALQVANQLFHQGVSTLAGKYFTVRSLPMAVGDGGPPRVLVGGGSDGVLELAARYADHVDLNGSSRRQRLGRTGAAEKDRVRRITTTFTDLESSVTRLNELAEKAGRDPRSVRHSIVLDTLDVCDAEDIQKRRVALAASRGVEDVRTEDCPYVLIGPADELVGALEERVSRLELSALIVPDGPNLEVLMREIIPRLSSR
jgi:alkanesulfonate monooxygenase SsuD/methylene tetrahydromethanopterin reductase-like flavin-dependent oxidoreductase (luciferase family)